MRDLNIILIQNSLLWEDPDANLTLFDEKLEKIEVHVDMVVLPEMFTTGFSMNAEALAQPMDGETVQWLREKSALLGADMVGSAIIEHKGRFYNRLLWATPGGDLHVYDKRHMFRMAGEDAVYSPGSRLLTVDLHGWRIRPFICYDLRFPFWTRNRGNEYDLAVFVANWPEKRASHWRTLLKARAIENQCYVVGVNRIGMDGAGVTYRGDSAIIDPQGKVMFELHQEPCVQHFKLSKSLLKKYRRDFPAWMDADIDLMGGGEKK